MVSAMHIRDKVNAELTAVLRVPEIQQRINDLIVVIAPAGRDEFAQFIRAETACWLRVVKASGIPPQ
jgi:tripartite-type tricarboxylate transporter receptor subunit TctC